MKVTIFLSVISLSTALWLLPPINVPIIPKLKLTSLLIPKAAKLHHGINAYKTKQKLKETAAEITKVEPLYDPSKYKSDDYYGWIDWLQHVPPDTNIRDLAVGFARRAAHSFLNNDKYSLEGVTPELDHLHHVINRIGQLVLPDPRLLRYFNGNVPSLIHQDSYLMKRFKNMTLLKHNKPAIKL